MKRSEADRLSTADVELATAPATFPSDHAADPSHDVITGHVLWTLTKGESTAEARGWSTASGFELDVQIWTGARVAGHEDLVLTQMFPTEDALAEAARAKKRQLERAGWTETIDAAPA